MTFKFEGNQELFLEGRPVTVFGRTEFFNGKQPRYYVQGEGGESWVNEDALSNVPSVTETTHDTLTLNGVRGKKSMR